MQRGFKSRCEEYSVDVREELGLTPEAPLDPLAFAQHLGVLVWAPEEVPGVPLEHLDRLVRVDSGSWSAVTLQLPEGCVVIVNSAHSSRRQTSSIMHELSHLVLKHKPARVDVSEKEHLLLSSHDKNQEEEANWLAGTLLLPRPALVAIKRQGLSEETACRRYGVSTDMLRWRLAVTGVKAQFEAITRKRRRSRTATL